MRIFDRINPWIYGTCNGVRARRRARWGRDVQLVLWKAGQMGHAEDFWHPFHDSHWPNCIPDPKP